MNNMLQIISWLLGGSRSILNVGAITKISLNPTQPAASRQASLSASQAQRPDPSQARLCACLRIKASCVLLLSSFFKPKPHKALVLQPFHRAETSCLGALALPFTNSTIIQGQIFKYWLKVKIGMMRIAASRHFQFARQERQRRRIRFCGTTMRGAWGNNSRLDTVTQRKRKRCKTGNMRRRSKWLDWASCASFRFRPPIYSNTENKLFCIKTSLREGWLPMNRKRALLQKLVQITLPI